MAGFILMSGPRNHHQNHVIVGGGNFIQQGPYGMGSPTPFGMVSSTPYGMVNPMRFGMVIQAPCVRMVAHPHPNNHRPPAFGPSLILQNAYPRVPAGQNNNTDYSDTYRRTPCLEEIPDNTKLVRRKPSASGDVDYTRPKPIQKDTYKLNDCKKDLENFGKEIISVAKKEFSNFVENFDSNELKKRWDLEDEKKEKERKERKENEEALWKISFDAIGKEYSSTHLFKALRYTKIPGETSQAILDAVDQSWCISNTEVTLIFYGNEQPQRETRISTRGDNRLIIHVHENGFWNLEWERKTCTKAIGKEYSSIHLFNALQNTPIPGETSQAILDAVNKSWCISDTQVYLIFYGKNQPKHQIKIAENGSNILNIHVHENGFWKLEWVEKTCTKVCMDGLSGITSVFPFDYIAGGFNLLSFLFTSKK